MQRDDQVNGRRPRRAWIIDDSKTEAEMARRALCDGYEVELFHDSSAALEQLTTRPAPDVLILDWVMPGLSGIDVCEFVRKRPETHELPVLLLTTNQQTAQVVEGLEAGANDYLAKPYAPAELRARVAALLRSRDLLERAEHAEGLLRQVLSQLPDAVITVDAAGSIVFANTQFELLFRLAPGSLPGRKIQELVPSLEPQRLESPAARQSTLGDFEIGERIYSPRVSIPPNDDEGNTTFTLRDVTDVRLREARRVDFYSMVAHDLRSPLSALQMRAQMMLKGLRGEVSPEVKAELEKMIARVRDLVQIVNDFLDISQMESARFQIERGDVDLGHLLAAVHDEYRPVAASRGLELVFSGAPDVFVSGDARRLTQVATNALKFTPAGGRVTVDARIEGPDVEISVADNGRGIPLEAQSRLFTKYERVGGAAVARIEGTGLGLAIVKEIVEAHGGTVGVHSQESGGSTFWFRLPRVATPG